MHHNSFYGNQYPTAINLQELYPTNTLQYQIAQNQAFSTYPKQNFLSIHPNPYTYNPLQYQNSMRDQIGLGQQNQVQRERKIDTTEHGQYYVGKSSVGNVKQRVANYNDQLMKSNKPNKDIIKQQRSEHKKVPIKNQNNIIVIDDEEEEVENIEIQKTTNKDKDSSSVEVIDLPKPKRENTKNNDKIINVSQMNRHSENTTSGQKITTNNQNSIQKIKPLDQSEKCEINLQSKQNNANKSTTSATQNNANKNTEKRVNSVNTPKKEINEKQSVIILSDEDEEDESLYRSQPKDIYTYQKTSKQNHFNSIINNNFFPFSNKNIDGQLSDPQSNPLYRSNQIVKNIHKGDNENKQIAQFDRLLQPYHRNQIQFISSLTQNHIPLYGVSRTDIRNQQKSKDDEITIEQIINPNKMHINDQLKANPVRRNPYDLSKAQLQYSQNPYDKNKLHRKHLKYTKSSSSSPYPVNSINQLHKKQKIIEINDNIINSQSLNNSFKNSSLQQQSYKQSQYQKMGELSSPGLNHSNSMDERDGKQNKKIQNSKFIYCKKCDKQIEQNQMKKGPQSDGQDLCKICFQLKQKNEISEKRYWEQVFRNAEDRINVIEVGVEYQAEIPEYNMNNLQVWQQKNKEKFQAILQNKVHSACDNQICKLFLLKYFDQISMKRLLKSNQFMKQSQNDNLIFDQTKNTDVLTAVRQKYNEKYSHNDFQALIKNSKLTLTQMKEKMIEDDQEFLNIIENCSSNACKNQRVTRLTKRRLEYLQNY